jgi:hypothetical protein
LNGEFKEYQQRNARALTSAFSQSINATWKSAHAEGRLGRRLTMKAAKFINLLMVLAGFAALRNPGVYAQSEVNPDQFDSPNTEHRDGIMPDLASRTKELGVIVIVKSNAFHPGRVVLKAVCRGANKPNAAAAVLAKCWHPIRHRIR